MMNQNIFGFPWQHWKEESNMAAVKIVFNLELSILHAVKLMIKREGGQHFFPVMQISESSDSHVTMSQKGTRRCDTEYSISQEIHRKQETQYRKKRKKI